MATLEEADPDTLILQLSWRPIYAHKAMIDVVQMASPTFLDDRSRTISSAGALDAFPLEIIHLIFASLDFQSLFYFLCASLRCRALVETFPAYKETTTHAAGVLMVINRMKLLEMHTAASIHLALRSESCTRCNDYGPFLFLPAVKRCCLNCLCDDSTL